MSEFRNSKFDFHARLIYIKLSQFIVTCSLLYLKKISFGGEEENNVTNNALFLQHTWSLH